MDKELSKQFITAADILPDELWRAVYSLCAELRPFCEEIRLRVGRPPVAIVSGKNRILTSRGKILYVTQEDIDKVIEKASRSSYQTFDGQMKNGFLTEEHGHRIGICGEISENGRIKNISSLNIRIAKEIKGIAEPFFRDEPKNTLIISVPGGGKTTFLRDAVRFLSEKYTVCCADERYEIAAMHGGKPTFDIGCADIMSGGSKESSLNFLIRGMTPQVIAVDEITEEKDAVSVQNAAFCGAKIIATAHCQSVRELAKRRIYISLSQIFERMILIENIEGTRKYGLYERNELDENARNNDDNNLLLGNRYFSKTRIFAEDEGT